MRVALAQIDAVVGDISGNERMVREQLARARAEGAQLALFPELAITGYPPEDLLLKEHFLADARAAADRVAEDARGIVAILGFPERATDVCNAAAVLADGAVRAIYRKVNLPNYGVFDEVRYFQRGEGGAVIDVDGVTVGLTVCEDIWVPGPPLTDEALAGARLIVNISASPYSIGKGCRREQMIATRARDNLAAVAFCALVGGQDELVFDGHSFVVDHEGEVIARARQFDEQLLICEVDVAAAGAARLRDTRRDAEALARNLGIELVELPIGDAMRAYDDLLAGVFAGREPDLTEENLQARIRGNLLMAVSNKFGWLVLTTGNKSEMAVGYSTLYGDSAGGFAVVKDVPKLLVYRLVRERARREPGRNPVPESILTRPPSAELRPDQRDEDALPSYDILDRILEGYVEEDLGRDQLIARGLPEADVDRVIGLVDRAEYKRRQQPPGIKVTARAFGRDRRMPITNRFRG